MLSDTDPLLPSYSEPYQLALQSVTDQDSGQKTGILCQSPDLPPMENIPAPASAGDEKEGRAHDNIEKPAEPVKAVRPTSKEFKKTWGFRSTTIAKREMPGDVGAQDGRDAPVRRSARQIRRSGKVEEFISTTKRERGGRRSAPAYLESSEPRTQMPTYEDSEASFEGSAGARATEESANNKQPSERQTPASVSAVDGSSSNDSDELTLKELQELLKKRHNRALIRPDRETDSLIKEDGNGRDESAAAEPIEGRSSGSPTEGTSQDSMSAHMSQKSTVGGQPILDSEEELPGKSDNEGHDSNALYCICQQKHNNRFMICCDRCEEWFHGDCVGITVARGRLLERNRDDYVCPNCTAQRSQPPATRSSEVGKQTEGSPSTVLSSNVEDTHREDQWIRGKIERASIPSGKKKIKIFQLVMETSSLPKCIGPGCDKNALLDSVYCGTDCILKHAAVTMKSLTTMKEPAPKAQPQRKCATKSISKGRLRSLPRRKLGRMSMESCSRAEGSSNSEEEAEVEHVPAAPFWSSEKNCNTLNPGKTAAIPSSVVYRSSVKESAENEDRREPAHLQQQSPPAVTFPKGSKQNTVHRDPPYKRNKPVPLPLSWDGASRKSTLPPSRPTIYKKPSPAPAVASQPVCPPASRHHVLGALRVSKTTYTIPRKLPSQPQLYLAPSTAAGLVFPSPVVASEPPWPQPNNQIRHNICRSLTEIMYKRVSDSDDLEMSEREVGKLAVHIEEEMYNLFFNTDNKYKTKYRTIMLNLKDPKNKGLFYQVVSGEVTPFKLVRLSPEELLSKDFSTWMHREATEVPDYSLKAHPGQLKLGLKQEASPSMDMDDSPPMSDGDACISANSLLHGMASAPEQEEHGLTSPLDKPCQPHLSSSVTDLFSKMLTDTTAEHKTHLFNLNCKICTGQMSADDEPVAKKPKNSVNKKADAKARQVSRSSKVADCPVEGTSALPLTSRMFNMESPASPDDSSTVMLSQPITIPAVPSVTITGRDPRTAQRAFAVTSAATSAISSSSESTPAIKPVLPPPPPPSIPKSILLKPTSSSNMPFFGASSMVDSHSRPGGETALFLSKQEVVWKGLINMHNVAKFVTKAYLVSGSPEHLKEDLPDTIHIGGRISPETVWDYVAKLKTTPSKELCLIRFHPVEEEVAYISLFSYFNSRGRFGVVANNSRHIKDLYLIPLGAKASIPSKLLPFEGPGLEPNHPNLLLGLVICQKPKRSGTLQGEEGEEKYSKLLTKDTGLRSPATLPSADMKPDKDQLHNPEMSMIRPYPGSPSSISSSESSSSSVSTPLMLSILRSVKASAPVATNSGKDSSSPAAAPFTSPLQTILKTLFGKNKLDSKDSLSPSEHSLVEMAVPPAPLLDPIVQQFGHISKETVIEEDEDPEEEYDPGMGYGIEDDEDDRPYDPEEEYNLGIGYGMKEDEDNRPYDPEKEYDLGIGYGMETLLATPQTFQAGNLDAAFSDDDVAYDPEDETIFEEVKSSVNEIPSQIKGEISPKQEYAADSESSTLTEQRKMLEELNKQIEEHKQQLAEQEEVLRQQRAAVGVSLAHFSVSDALMSPPSKPLLAKLGKMEEMLAEPPVAPVIKQRGDPRPPNKRRTSDTMEKDSDIDASVRNTTSQPEHTAQSPMVTQAEPFSFLDTESSEVSISLPTEKIEPEIKDDFLQERALDPNITNKVISPAEIESNPDTSCLNSAKILKIKECSSHQLNNLEQSQALPVVKSFQTSYHSILRNNTRHRSSKLPGISHDITLSNISKADNHEPPMRSMRVLSPNFRGPEKMALSIPFQSLVRSSPEQRSPRLQGENDQPPYKDPSQCMPTDPNQNQQRGEKRKFDSLRRCPLIATMVPRGPHHSKPVGQRGPFPESDPAMGYFSPKNTGERGLSPGQFMEGHGSPSLDGQNDLHKQSYNIPPPSFNLAGPRSPPLRHISSRGSRPTHFPGPRSPPPHHKFAEHKSQKFLLDTVGQPNEQQYNRVSYLQHMEVNHRQTPPHMYRENQGSLQTHCRGHLPHFEGQRGPGGEIEGQGFPPPEDFKVPRAPSPDLHSHWLPTSRHRGSFGNQRSPMLPKLKGERGAPLSQFGGPRDLEDGILDNVGQLRFHLEGQHYGLDERPLRHSGPLLPTPLEPPILLPSHMRNSPDSYREDFWRHSPGTRRSGIRDESKPQNNGNKTRMFEGDYEEVNTRGLSCLSEERLSELSEDRRREQDASHSRLLDRNPSKSWSREQEWDRSTGREKDQSRGREVDSRRKGNGEKRDRDQDRERDRAGDRDWDMRDFVRERSRNRDWNKAREHDQHNRERRRVRSVSRDQPRDHGRDKERDSEKDGDCRKRSKSKEVLKESEKHS